jgi:REP element-mobilizing transposase RayT
MSDGGYKIRNKEGIHFITFAVVEWVDVFTRKEYRDIVLDSVRYCQKEKGLILYAWCIMSNHVSSLPCLLTLHRRVSQRSFVGGVDTSSIKKNNIIQVSKAFMN